MRLLAATTLLLLLAACPAGSVISTPPADLFYWPTGLVHVDGPGGEGVLFVANANFDKRYESGNVLGIDLKAALTRGLPAFGELPVAPVQVTELGVTPGAVAQVASFTGEIAALPLGGDRYRLFVPSRSEGDQLHAIDAQLSADGSATLSCATPAGRDDRECFSQAPSLTPTDFERSETGLPRAPAPFGVALRLKTCAVAADCGGARTCTAGVCQSGGASGPEPVADVFVSHLSEADSPYLSQTNHRSYLVRVDSDAVTVDESNFTDLGQGAVNAVAAGQRWTYLSGRASAWSALNLVRLASADGAVFASSQESAYRVLDARGLALAADEQRLYVAGRRPDSLVVMKVEGANTTNPVLQTVNAVSLPSAPNTVRTIARPGRSDLVVVVCTGAGVLVMYDDDAGRVVAQVPGVGLQPFGLSVDVRGAGARLFVSNFGDGRVAVVDIPDLTRPHEAQVVAHLGTSQRCLGSTASDPNCTGGAQ